MRRLKRWIRKNAGLAAIVITMVSVGFLVTLGVLLTSGSPATPTPTPTPALTLEDYNPREDLITAWKDDPQYRKPVTLPYEELFRNSEKHMGKFIRVKGEVIQVLGEMGAWELRVNVTDKSSYGVSLWDDTVYVVYYSDKRVIEKDIIEFTGLSEGVTTYETTMGNEITIPSLTTINARVVGRTE